MRKCEKCGREIEDWGICPCSQQQEFYYSQNNEFSSVNQNMNQAPEPFVIDNFDTKKPKSKNLVPILGLLVIAIVAVICYQFVKDDSYKEPIDNLCLLVNTKEDNPKILFSKIMPGFVGDALVGTLDTFNTNGDILTTINAASDSMNELYDEFQAECGSDFLVTYKVKWKSKMSQTELDKCKAGMDLFYTATIEPAASVFKEYDSATIATYMGGSTQKIEELKNIYAEVEEEYRNLEITEGYTLTVEFKFKGSQGVAKSKSEFNVIKVNGKWTFDYFTAGNGNSLSIHDLIE
ncbi:MAG: hypothetical protein IJA32_07890 [Lachnospiraceae bacterium]|nr:hypothetical protein [Lachnospiraceae bacterium]